MLRSRKGNQLFSIKHCFYLALSINTSLNVSLCVTQHVLHGYVAVTCSVDYQDHYMFQNPFFKHLPIKVLL